MQFSEISGATVRIGYGGGAFDVLVTGTTPKWIDGLIQPSGEKVVMVIAQLADDEDLDAYARNGVFEKSVAWITPGQVAFLIAESGNAHFWIDSLEKVG
ncbi:hypothetical protein [Microbacterium enclense]|uniref:hypothetical protein n=1 Tax=Microbacterium enclense TaxID=993073 RepID=UPI0034487F8B